MRGLYAAIAKSGKIANVATICERKLDLEWRKGKRKAEERAFGALKRLASRMCACRSFAFQRFHPFSLLSLRDSFLPLLSFHQLFFFILFMRLLFSWIFAELCFRVRRLNGAFLMAGRAKGAERESSMLSNVYL